MLLSQSDKFNLKRGEESNKERKIHVAEGESAYIKLTGAREQEK